MQRPAHQVRRATLDDLPRLREIWREERFPIGELERRFTEFQVVEDGGGRVIGALALRIQNQQGHIHSETIAEPQQTDWLRPVLWERLRKVAGNHGLVRLWTEAHAFWSGVGFRSPDDTESGKRPTAFGEVRSGWVVLPLKEESTTPGLSLEQELTLFREAQKEETARFQQQAKVIKLIASITALLFAAVVFIGGYYWWRYKQYRDSQGAPPPSPEGPAAFPAPTNPPPAQTSPPAR